MPATRHYYIETPAGVRIANRLIVVPTQTGRLPDVVTMNRAHSTHYSLFPDSAFRTCCTAGAMTDSRYDRLRVGDVLIRM